MRGPESLGSGPSSFSGRSLNTAPSPRGVGTIDRALSSIPKVTISKSEATRGFVGPKKFSAMPDFRPQAPRAETTVRFGSNKSLLKDTVPFVVPDTAAVVPTVSPKFVSSLKIHETIDSPLHDALKRTTITNRAEPVRFEVKKGSIAAFKMPRMDVPKPDRFVGESFRYDMQPVKKAEVLTNTDSMLNRSPQRPAIKPAEVRFYQPMRRRRPAKQDVEMAPAEQTSFVEAVLQAPIVKPREMPNVLPEVQPMRFAEIFALPQLDVKPKTEAKREVNILDKPAVQLTPHSTVQTGSESQIKTEPSPKVEENRKQKKSNMPVILYFGVSLSYKPKQETIVSDATPDISTVFVRDSTAATAFVTAGLKAADRVMGRIIEKPVTGVQLVGAMEVSSRMKSGLVKEGTDGSLQPRLQYIAGKTAFFTKEEVTDVFTRATEEIPPVTINAPARGVQRRDVDLVLSGVERISKPTA